MKISEILQNTGRQVSDTIDLCDTTNFLLEIEDYVVTEDVLKNLIRILHYYNNPNSESRIFWIEGEFGVGKSYFLKILSTLMENKQDQSKHLSSAILSKIRDEEERLELESAIQIPSECIIFNLANELTKERSIVEVFYRNFNKHRGFCEEPTIAALEMWLEGEGRLEEFKQAFNTIKAEEWVESRLYAGFFLESEINRIIETLFEKQQNKIILLSEFKENHKQSIKEFIQLVTEYLNTKEKGFRLNFFIDSIEIFQDKEIFELWTIVDRLSAETSGQVSIFLSSSSPKAGSELFKLKGKVNFQFHLSAHEDYKILQYRLLNKNIDHKKLLHPLFSLSEFFKIQHHGSVPLLIEEYSNFYPFLPYQASLYKESKISLHRKLPNAFEYQPKYHSYATREHLRVFSNILGRIKDKPANKIVPFDYFFDELTHLKEESYIKKHIRINEIKFPLEMRILKVLFMTQFSTQFQSTAENIARLLIDDLKVDWEKHYKTVENGLKQLCGKKVVNQNRDRYFYFPLSDQMATELENP